MPIFKRVDELTAATGVTGTDRLILSRITGPSGTVGTRSVTLTEILALATGGGGSGGVGATGPTGGPGAAGSNGSVGATGPTGLLGATGSNGSAGATGPTGLPGAAGSNGAASTVTGPTGSAGTSGSAGATGPTGPGGAGGSPTVTGVSLSGTGVYDPLILDGAYDAYYLTLATGAAIQSLDITGPTGTTKLVMNIGTTGVATINHATGVNANARASVQTQGNFLLPTRGGVAVLQYDGAAWRVF